jgi:hypothetical protein
MTVFSQLEHPGVQGGHYRVHAFPVPAVRRFWEDATAVLFTFGRRWLYACANFLLKI